MKEQMPSQEWMLLVHQLPPQPTNLRVRTWRKLQKLGAVAVKNSVYVLPFNEKTHEDFQWLKQEIESAGGEAAVFRAGAVEGATDAEIIALFRKSRDEEYGDLKAELDALTGALGELKRGGRLSAARLGRYEADLDKLHRELERIVSTDFFNAAGRAPALAGYERCRKALRAGQSREQQPLDASHARSGLKLEQYQGRRWVTRRNLYIDRLASIWLIKRFIDPTARFFFVADGEAVEGAIGFDLYGGEFTHRGEDCTFETMIKEFELADDAGLRAMAEIVHDIDLKDQKFGRSEAAGLATVIRGLAATLKDDRKLGRHCAPLFDGLYEMLAGEQVAPGKKKDGKKRIHGGSGKGNKGPARD